MKLIFASNNINKLNEIQKVIPQTIQLVSLRDAGIVEDIPEPFETFRENALAKADYVYQKTGLACFAEDSGLVVPALDGAPGVFSARYAGLPSNDENNNNKLLQALEHVNDRAAFYQCCICLRLAERIEYFEGECHGSIAYERSGTNGFGYDPLFIPSGFDATFGTLAADIKTAISHRTKAVQQFVSFLNSNGQ